eukprot:gene14063-biopygen38763
MDVRSSINASMISQAMWGDRYVSSPFLAVQLGLGAVLLSTTETIWCTDFLLYCISSPAVSPTNAVLRRRGCSERGSEVVVSAALSTVSVGCTVFCRSGHLQPREPFNDTGDGDGLFSLCGESDDGWACVQNAGLAGARGTCEGVGARLCSAAEVALAAMGTGCGHDARYVWTATTCDNGHLRVKGNNAGDTQCALDGDTAAVRCCADQYAAPTESPITLVLTVAPTDSPATMVPTVEPTESPATMLPSVAPTGSPITMLPAGGHQYPDADSFNRTPPYRTIHRPHVSATHRPHVSATHRPHVSATHRPHVAATHKPHVSATHLRMEGVVPQGEVPQPAPTAAAAAASGVDAGT